MKNFKTLFLVSVAALVAATSCKKDDGPAISRITFEEIELGPDGFWNGSGGEGGFTSGNAFFRNSFSVDQGTGFEYWSGFAVSNHTDKTTPGLDNQYSSISGGGEQSDKYAVLYSYALDTIKFDIPQKIKNISISNSTYAYLSMKNGDNFAKKFGGLTGDDPDYFCLVFKAVDHNGTVYSFSDSLFLADYRFPDNSNDYIFDSWINADFSSIGFIKYLIFKFDSSDKTGEFINTPTYICIDNIVGEMME
jgi:hypothetical protein